MAGIWILEEQYYLPLTIASCIIALFLNFIAVPLSIYYSKYSLGSYKIVMALFSINNMLHSSVDTFTLPKYFFKRYLIVVYTSGPIRHLGAGPAYFCSTWLCVVFLLQIFVEALHFLFRYIVLCRIEYRQYLSIKTVSLVAIPSYLTYAFIAAVNYMINLSPSEDYYDYVGDDGPIKANLTAREMQGVVMLYMKKGQDGDLVINWSGCIGMTILMTGNTILIGMMIFCGWKIHQTIKNTLALSHMSPNAIEMNKTLFNLLLVQTIVPLLLLHTPCVIVLLGPFFVEIGSVGELLMLAIVSYSVFEPLVVVYFLLKRRWKKSVAGTASQSGVAPITSKISQQ